MNLDSKDVHPIIEERLARLQRLFTLNAPMIILAIECALVVRAWHGNSLWRTGFYFLCKAVNAAWWRRVARPWFTALCRLGIYHNRDEEGICFVCERDRDGKLEEEGDCCDTD